MALTMCINPIYLTLPAGELNLSNLTFFKKDGAHHVQYINSIYLTLPAGKLKLSNLTIFIKDGAHHVYQPHLPDPARR
jgi:hypothetical protein